MAQPRRIAVIDVNHWHSTYDAAYLKVLRGLDVDLVGLSDPNPDIANDRAAKFETTAFTDAGAMLDDVQPDFVIALGRHVDMPATARMLVDRGIPFLMEKPMGPDAATVAALADEIEAKGAWVAVPFPNRGTPWAQTAKAMIESGELGAISHVVMRMIRPTMQRYVEWDSPWMWDRAAAGGGALTNLGGHGMDMARFLLGPDLKVATAVISNAVHAAEVEDYALATLRSATGALMHVEVGYTMPTWPANQTDGERKVAGARALLREVPEGLHILAPGRDEVLEGASTVVSGYPVFVKDCLDRVGADRPPAVSARDCAEAVALIHDAYRLAGRL